MNLYQKLAKARVELQNSKLNKTGKNKFANFDYFELKDFLPRVNEIFNELGLVSVFNLGQDTASLTIMNAEKPEERETFISTVESVELKGCVAIQALGATHTYLKRYLYLNALEIVESDLLDNVSGGPMAPQKSATRQAKPTANVQVIRDLIEDIGDPNLEPRITKAYKVGNFEELNENQVNNIVNQLKEMINTKEA